MGLNVDIAPDLIANQLNVRYGVLVLQVPGNSLAAKAGLLPTTRGLAGNIVLGDTIVAVDNKPVGCYFSPLITTCFLLPTCELRSIIFWGQKQSRTVQSTG